MFFSEDDETLGGSFGFIALFASENEALVQLLQKTGSCNQKLHEC